MQPVTHMSLERLKKIIVLLTDIDDTLTENGLLPAASLVAIERVEQAGIAVIPVTGRPAGWCDHIARMWPVAAVVGENGAFYFSYDRCRRKMRQCFAKNEQERGRDRERLELLRTRIVSEVPGAGIASDQDYRIADLAIDFREDVDPLPEEEIKQIVRIFEENGATAKISSIHVNGWFGTYDKLSMTRICLRDLLGIDIERDNEKIGYVGDSPNDSPMFHCFENSIGVANVADFVVDSPPKWITNRRCSGGFVEFAELLLTAQAS